MHKTPAWPPRTNYADHHEQCGDLASSQLGLTHFPVIVVDQLTEAQPRALRIAGNKIVESARWDDGAGHRRLTETKTNTNHKDKQ